MTKIFVVYFLFLGVCFDGISSTTEERLDEIENKLLDLELETVRQSQIETHGVMQTIYKKFSVRNDSPTIDDSELDTTVSMLELSFNNTVNNQLKVYSSIGAKYFWNNSFLASSEVEDGGASEVRGSYLYVLKSYFDYFSQNRNYVLSLGRLPTVNGPPIEKLVAQDRLGTYPVLLYSIPLDGIAMTFNLKNIFNFDRRSVLRFIYSPFYNYSSFEDPSSVGAINKSVNFHTTSGEALYINFETSGAIKNWFDYALIIQGYNTRFGRSKATEARGVAESTCQSGGSSGALCGSTAGPDGNMYEVYSEDSSLATLKAAILHIDLKRIYNSGFNFYGSFKKTKFESNGALSAVLSEQNNGGAAGPGTSLGEIGGFLYSEDKESTEYVLGLKYDFKKYGIGYEYLNRTLGGIPAAVNTYALSEFYDVVGYAQHFYLNFKARDNFTINLGYMHLNKESVLNGLMYKDEKNIVDGVYTNIFVRF